MSVSDNLKKRGICTFLVISITMSQISGITPVFADTQKIQTQTINAGSTNIAVIKNDGSLWAWGNNISGQLGDGSTTASALPVKAMDNNVVAVSGDSHTAVIKTDGSLWTWGYNGLGQLGDGTNTDRHTPKKVMDKIVAVSAGDSYTAVIKTDRSLWTWGSNNYGQLGNGKIDGMSTAGIKPAKVMDKVMAVSAGTDHAAAIKTDGSLWTWGQNWAGQLGDNIATFWYTPKKVMDKVAAVTTGFAYTAAIKTDGSLWTWGSNRSGQLGDGTNTNRYTPKKVMDNVASVSASISCTAAIKTDGSLWTWGSNNAGQLGDGTNRDKNTPVKVMDDVIAVSISNSYTTIIKTDGSLWICGDNWINPYSNVPIKILEDVSLGNSVLQKTLSYEVKDSIKVLLNNQQITFGQPPIIKDSQILVPAREIFESMGAAVKWNGATQTITATKGDVNIIMQIDFNIISRNGQQSKLDVSPQIINGKTFVPAKAVADALSAYFDWDENKQMVSIATLDTKLSKSYVKYEEKMKTYGFDKLYNNKRADTNEPVTKAEALKLALGAVFNTNDISGFAAENNEYENAIWVKFAKDSEIAKEDINSSNFAHKAKYIDVITYFENCKMKFLKEQPIKAAEVNLKDISKYTTEQQTAIKDMVANEVIYLLSDNLNGNENIFKGQLNEVVVNFVEKYNTIAPLGEVLNTDPKKMPSNADKYPYILASVDKSIYEKPFMPGYDAEKMSPKELYTYKKDLYPQVEMRCEDYFDNILNIDYRTITKEDLKEKLGKYMIFSPNESGIKYYVKYVKDNEIIIEGSSQLQFPTIYSDGMSFRARLRLKFEVKHSKTNKNLLYLDSLDTFSKVYGKDNYDILVDYRLTSALGNNNMYLNETGLYKTILDKDKSGITEEVEK